MSSHKPTVWMNVTTSSNWQRPAVGVVRVEKELTEGLERLIGAAHFKRCVWAENRFIELAYQASTPAPTTVSANSTPVAAQPAQVEAPVAESALMFPLLPRKAALLALAQAALSLTPARFRPFANRLLLSAKARTSRYLQQRRNGLVDQHPVYAVNEPGTSGVSTPGVEFKAGDILVSVGLDWDHLYWRSFAMLRKTYGLKIVTCCYDLIPVIYPQYCVSDVAKRFTGYFIDVAEGSDLILCISKQTERDLKSLLASVGSVDVPTHIFPLGDNVIPATLNISPAISQLTQEPYVLFVSTIERRKNHEVLYRAYHLLCAQGHRDKLPKLVFVGMQGWGVAELLKDIELDPLTNGLIVQLNHVSDGELRHLYEKARFFVFPSLYEGWGLPVGEALALGKAVLCSDRGSLPEVGGDLVTYIDPWVPAAWAEQILALSTDADALARFESTVQSQYRIRKWEDACVSVDQAIRGLMQREFSMNLRPGYDMLSPTGSHIGAWIKSRGTPGWLMIGPYRSVPAGEYRVAVELADLAMGTRLVIDVVSNSGNTLHAETGVSHDPSASENDGSVIAVLHFTLDQPAYSVEIRCRLETGDVTIRNVSVEQVGALVALH